MNSFLKGVIFGIGIGLLVAPMKGEELRKNLSERFSDLQDYLPEREQLNTYTQQVSGRVAQSADTMKGYARQAAHTMKHTASNLNDIAQNVASVAKQTGKDLANTTKQNIDNVSST